VYKRFPILKVDEDRRMEMRESIEREEHAGGSSISTESVREDWAESVAMPISYGWSAPSTCKRDRADLFRY